MSTHDDPKAPAAQKHRDQGLHACREEHWDPLRQEDQSMENGWYLAQIEKGGERAAGRVRPMLFHYNKCKDNAIRVRS